MICSIFCSQHFATLEDDCGFKTDVYDAGTDTWEPGPDLKYPVYTPPCLIDLGNSENLIITHTEKGYL